MRIGGRKTGPVHRILVVDDDAELLASTVQLLRADGHEVQSASEAARALSLVAEWRPHLVLLDYHLRETTGAMVAPKIRALDDVCQVLLVTGYASEQPARKLLADLEIQGYHDKADGPHRLLVLVDSAVMSTAVIVRIFPPASSSDRCVFMTPESRKAMPTPVPYDAPDDVVAACAVLLPGPEAVEASVRVVTRSAEMLATSARWESVPIWSGVKNAASAAPPALLAPPASQRPSKRWL